MRLRTRWSRGLRESGEDGFSWGESLIRGLVDLFLLTLLWIVAQQPEIGLGAVKVVETTTADEDKQNDARPSGHGDRLLLHTDGALVWNDELLDCGAVVSRLAALDQSRTVSLVIETQDGGSGAVRELLELQIACSKAGVWQRIEVLYRPTAAPAGGSK